MKILIGMNVRKLELVVLISLVGTSRSGTLVMMLRSGSDCQSTLGLGRKEKDRGLVFLYCMGKCL